MSSFKYWFLSFGLIASFSLAACMEGNNTTTARDGSGPARAGQVAERDIEDPDIFSRRENALWDGRPSLGGVWVAHPEARTPERVIIRNTTNGQETIGALFRRERLNPGPAFQVSGEAADAIGILAGAPTMIEVIALRTEDVQTEDATVQTEPAAEGADAPAVAPAAPAQAQETDAAPDIETSVAPPEAEQAPRRQGGLLSRIFGRGDAPAEAAPAPADRIETQTLDDGAVQAQAEGASPPSATPATAPTPTPGPRPAADASALDRPYIQLGIFSVESNAGNAQRLARDAGLSARVIEGQTQGNAFWRVVVGPAATQAERSQMLARVKSLGFNDAYTVRR